MDLSHKIVLITGASSGIGRACAHEFARLKTKLLLCARRGERLESLAQELAQLYGVEVYTFACDVSDAKAVTNALDKLPAAWREVDILINNAGLALGLDKTQEGKLTDWDIMIDTNIKGVLYVTRFVLAGMVRRNSGHIINIGSISSHEVYPGGTIYCATKFAINALSTGIKMDVHGTAIRVSQVDPGMVETEYATVRFAGDKEKFAAVYRGLTPLNADDVAQAVAFCATRPPHVDVREIKIYPTAQTAALMVDRSQS